MNATATTHVPDPSTNVLLHVHGPATGLAIDFASQPGYDREQIVGLLVGAQNLGAIWSEYRAVGAQSLVVVGPIDDRDALGVDEAVHVHVTKTRQPDRELHPEHARRDLGDLLGGRILLGLVGPRPVVGRPRGSRGHLTMSVTAAVVPTCARILPATATGSVPSVCTRNVPTASLPVALVT